MVSGFLTSGNIYWGWKNKLESFAGNVKGKTVTFIPTASVVEKVNFFVKSGKKALEKMGMIIDELEVSTATIGEITEKLTQNDFIYITGGNTFFLLQELRKSGADKIIAEQIDSGKIYIGESAGSIVVAPDIEFAKAMDSIKKAVEKIIAAYGKSLTLKPISNHQAILVENSDVRIENI